MKILALLALLPLTALAKAYTLTGKVIHVTDGDTVTLMTSDHGKHRIRLYGIDTPEKKQPYGNKARQLMVKLASGKQATAKCSGKDRYSRDICTIYIDDRDINALMVEKGAAWVYRKYYKGSAYYKLEDAAKAQGLGLWNTSEYRSIPPWQWRKEHRKR